MGVSDAHSRPEAGRTSRHVPTQSLSTHRGRKRNEDGDGGGWNRQDEKPKDDTNGAGWNGGLAYWTLMRAPMLEEPTKVAIVAEG